MNKGKWNHPLDTGRLARALRTLEDLSVGGCRNNCMTEKQQWTDGYVCAMMKHYKHPVPADELRMAAANAWKENKDGV